MGLICNGYRLGNTPWRHYGSLTTIYNSYAFRNLGLTGRMRNLINGEGITTDKVSYPMGNTHPVAWMLPQKAGSLAAHNNAQMVVDGVGAGAMGVNGAGTLALVLSADAIGQLISSAIGTTIFTVTADGNIVATLGGPGAATLTVDGSGVVEALAWGVGDGTLALTAALVSYAIGHMDGTTEAGGLTPTSIASAVWGNDDAQTVRKMLENRVVRVGDTIRIYEDDGATVWREYDLADGGRERS